jgi:N-acetylmuramoyl-L-alanine amidase
MPGRLTLRPRAVPALGHLAVAAAAIVVAVSAGAVSPVVASPVVASPVVASPVVASNAAAGAGPAQARSGKAPLPLAGKIIGIDPGHNGRNWVDPAFIDHLIWNGRQWEACDTTGTSTSSGYPEPRFTFNVAMYLAADLRADGAKVVLTRKNNRGVGPCVNTRAYILDRAHANVSIDIHADGGPSWGRGFTILEPVKDKVNQKVIGSSLRFGRDVHLAFLRHTPIQVSDYYGRNGYIFRNDLAGLNLTTMPKVLIECGNMRNAADARQLTSPGVQRAIARALTDAIIRFLSGH